MRDNGMRAALAEVERLCKRAALVRDGELNTVEQWRIQRTAEFFVKVVGKVLAKVLPDG